VCVWFDHLVVYCNRDALWPANNIIININ